jgi:hypothetical protein
MCGRVIQASPPDLLAFKIVNAMDPRDSRVKNGSIPMGMSRLASTGRRPRAVGDPASSGDGSAHENSVRPQQATIKVAPSLGS